MLSALVFAVVLRSPVAAQPESPIRLVDFVSLLTKAGYPMRDAARVSPVGTIRLKDAAVQVELTLAYDRHSERTEGLFDGARLSIEVPLGRDVPLEESDLDAVHAMPHLGRTAELTMSIPLSPTTTAAALRKSVERFAKEGATYAEQSGGEFRNALDTDWSRYRFDDALIVDRADKVSLKRLFSAWGFKERERSEASSELRGDLVDVGDTVVSIAVGEDSVENSSQTIRLSALVAPPQGEDAFTWAVGHSYVLTWLRVLPSLNGPAEFRQTLDLSKGLSVGQIRTRIVNFAATIRSIGS